jgi:ABC-2 type transport system ATP-binding protein
MKIGEQVIYLARLKGLDKQEAQSRAKEWFTRFGMESWWNKKTEDLSKGMGQKLQFVSTILHQPKLVILDEPFSGLDPVNANLIKDEIFKLAESGSTIIFSTHRMEQVEEICDHIVLINQGKKILDGRVQQVKMDFRKNLFEINFEGEIEKVPGELFAIKEQRPGQMIIQINEATETNTILEYLISRKIRIKGFREILPSINEIFISLVEGTGTARKFIKD